MAGIPLAGWTTQIKSLEKMSQDFKNSPKMPLIFLGHGHPMNALWDNSFTQSLAELGKTIEKPNAVMMISAHWLTRGTFVSVNPQPHTIYDFGGMDEALYRVKYEPKGHPELARKVIEAAPNFTIKEDANMGLDHGAWTVLRHIFPEADIPVFELSIDFYRPEQYHFDLAQQLKKLREKGVLIIGSGNITHNLRVFDPYNIDAPVMDWAQEFDALVKTKLDERDFKALIDYKQFGQLAQMAQPSNDHYLPILYILGLAEKNENIQYLFEGFQFGSLSMRCFQIS